jgi:hypothetical protein
LRARPALGVSVGEQQSHYCDTEQNKTDRAHGSQSVFSSDGCAIVADIGTIAVLGGRRGFKKLEAANLGPRRPGTFSKLPEKQIRQIQN